MAEHRLSTLTLRTAFFSTAHIETAARQSGFVQRASKITGTIFLALVTFGVWSDAQTTFAQLAAKVTQVEEHKAVSPEAIYQRLHKRASACRQELIRQALAKGQAVENMGEEGLLRFFTAVSLADSTGFALPDSRQETLPGSGGSAAKASAKIQAVWDDKSHGCGQFALTPWTIPDQNSIDTVVALAQQGALFIFDLGYFQLQAVATLRQLRPTFSVAAIIRRPSCTPWRGVCSLWNWPRFSKPSQARVPSTLLFSGPLSAWPLVSWPCVSQSPSSISAGAARQRRRSTKAILLPQPTWKYWRGTFLSPMCRLRYGRQKPLGRSILSVGK
jgi:hypothetical protein